MGRPCTVRVLQPDDDDPDDDEHIQQLDDAHDRELEGPLNDDEAL